MMLHEKFVQNYIGEFDGKKSLGTFSRSWKNNIKMNRKEIYCEGVEWIQLGQGRFCSEIQF
jgi:hypothetical protein